MDFASEDVVDIRNSCGVIEDAAASGNVVSDAGCKAISALRLHAGLVNSVAYYINNARTPGITEAFRLVSTSLETVMRSSLIVLAS